VRRTKLDTTRVPELSDYLEDNWHRVARTLYDMDDAMQKFATVRSYGSISRARLWRIGYIKSTRKSELLKQNDSAVVRDKTKKAFLADNERDRISLLCELRGVSVPRASAILSWTHPERWPVIDQRAWRTLRRFDIVSCYDKGTGLGPVQWEVFVQAVDALCAVVKGGRLTPQQIDRLLYQEDKDEELRIRRSKAA
jgi:hypothetical protein